MDIVSVESRVRVRQVNDKGYSVCGEVYSNKLYSFSYVRIVNHFSCLKKELLKRLTKKK